MLKFHTQKPKTFNKTAKNNTIHNNTHINQYKIPIKLNRYNKSKAGLRPHVRSSIFRAPHTATDLYYILYYYIVLAQWVRAKYCPHTIFRVHHRPLITRAMPFQFWPADNATRISKHVRGDNKRRFFNIAPHFCLYISLGPFLFFFGVFWSDEMFRVFSKGVRYFGKRNRSHFASSLCTLDECWIYTLLVRLLFLSNNIKFLKEINMFFKNQVFYNNQGNSIYFFIGIIIKKKYFL